MGALKYLGSKPFDFAFSNDFSVDDPYERCLCIVFRTLAHFLFTVRAHVQAGNIIVDVLLLVELGFLAVLNVVVHRPAQHSSIAGSQAATAAAALLRRDLGFVRLATATQIEVKLSLSLHPSFSPTLPAVSPLQILLLVDDGDLL